jgi:peptide/nickel transport system permease protein
MPPLLRFIILRLLSIPITLFFITAALYGVIMLFPPEVRASHYLPQRINVEGLSREKLQALTAKIIERHHFDEPYPVQYGLWLVDLLRGDWGYSHSIRGDVLQALLRRTPVTAELAFFSMLVFIPLGLLGGVISGWKKNTRLDRRFRFAAFTATSLPVFILAIVLIAIFYVMVNWFPPERLGIQNGLLVKSSAFRTYTGFLTIDGILNGRPEISLDALRHLVLPVFTLSLFHWGTLGRITRSRMIEELQKDYVMAARARGISTNALIWKHTFRNAVSPALASTALSTATLLTGVFVVELIFNFNGVSELVVLALRDVPDTPIALGFTIYSVVIVLFVMFLLDLLQAALDPRVRDGLLRR